MDRINSQAPSEIAARLRTRTTAPVASTAPARSAASDVERSGASRLAGLDLAGAEAPIDESRVADIRAAIERGQYLIEPERTADAMIAAGFMLRNER